MTNAASQVPPFRFWIVVRSAGGVTNDVAIAPSPLPLAP
jgi:hypothetical protein